MENKYGVPYPPIEVGDVVEVREESVTEEALYKEISYQRKLTTFLASLTPDSDRESFDNSVSVRLNSLIGHVFIVTKIDKEKSRCYIKNNSLGELMDFPIELFSRLMSSDMIKDIQSKHIFEVHLCDDRMQYSIGDSMVEVIKRYEARLGGDQIKSIEKLK